MNFFTWHYLEVPSSFNMTKLNRKGLILEIPVLFLNRAPKKEDFS